MDDIKTAGGSGQLLAVNHTLYFAADGGDGRGVELWRLPTGGAPGNALAFNGTNSCVDLGTNSPLALTHGAFTLEAWIKPVEQTNICALLGRKNGGLANPGYAFYLNTWNTADRRLRFETQDQNRGTTDPVITWDAWQHVAVTWDGGTLRFYVNGREQPASGGVNLTDGGVRAMLGAFPNSGYFFDGQMDEVRVWAVTRAEADLRDAMHRELRGDEPGLLAYYRFNHDLGARLADLTGNHFDGALVNNPVWTLSTMPGADTIANRANLRGVWADQTTSLASGRFSLAGATVAAPRFAVFGHDDGADDWQAGDVPDGIAKRLTRAWRAEVSGTVSAELLFSTTGLSDLDDGGRLRLLVDADGTFTNATVLRGHYAAPTFTVSGQTLGNGSFYTLALENRNPEARGDTIAVSSSGPTTVDVASLLSNDSDPDGDRLSVIGIGAPASLLSPLDLRRHSGGGVRDDYTVHIPGFFTVSLLGEGESILFQPELGWSFGGFFTYTVSDGHGGTAVGTVTVMVSDPGNPSQNPAPIENLGAGRYRVTFHVIPGLRHTIEYADSLTPPVTWTQLGAATANLLGVLSYDDTAPGPMRFYRTVFP